MVDELSGQLIFNPLLVKAGSGPNHLVTVELMESNGEMSLHPTQQKGCDEEVVGRANPHAVLPPFLQCHQSPPLPRINRAEGAWQIQD